MFTYVYLFIIILFYYKCEGFILSLYMGDGFKGTGSEVNTVCFGVQDVFHSALNTRTNLSFHDSRGSLVKEVGPV